MVFHKIDDILTRAASLQTPRKVAVADAAHEHTLEAVKQAEEEGFVTPLLVGRKTEIEAAAQNAGVSFAAECFVDVDSDDPDEIAAQTIRLVREGNADLIMKGRLNTSEVLRAVLNKESGLAHDKVVTQFTFAEIPGVDRLVVLNDASIIPYPTLEQKAEQIRVVAKTLRGLGYDEDIRVGILCGAETVNPKLQESVDAAELKKMGEEGAFPGCIVEGPISLDIALLQDVAKVKGFDSPVAGNADVLIFPNMTSGNFVAKMIALFAGGMTVGMVVGAGVPIALSSRAAKAHAKYLSLTLAAASVPEGGSHV